MRTQKKYLNRTIWVFGVDGSFRTVVESALWIGLLLLLLFIFTVGKVQAQTNPKKDAIDSATKPRESTGVNSGSAAEGLNKDLEQPWRISKALSLPAWFSIGLNHRSRYENLMNQYRATVSGDQPVHVMRSLLTTDLKWKNFLVRAELIDARAYYATSGTPVDTTLVNTFDILQGFGESRIPGVFSASDELRLRGGRFSLDLGNRRLVARNRFRNTINAFTGGEIEYKSASDDRVRLFVTMPVQRLPDDVTDLRNNKSKLDYETERVIFSGIYYEQRSFLKPVVTEVYALGLHEEDSPDLLTRNRRLVTPGLRVYVAPKIGSPDFEVEGAMQKGFSRASARASDTTDLEHFAWFGHASAGYTLKLFGQTRMSLEYQYATGNAASNAGKTTRFDSLYGARRFMFGPTSLYGAIALSNISTPGIRLEIRPISSVRTFLAYRYVQLAESSDSWTTSGLVDKTGNSGAFLGQQIEGEISWSVIPGNLSIDAGFAYFHLGSFPKNLKPELQNPVYVFTGLTFEL